MGKKPSEVPKTRAGKFLRQPEGYTAFIPVPLPPNPPLKINETLQVLHGEAERALGRLDSILLLIPDPDRFVHMYIRQEAVLSSQIEGTQASLSDLLEYEASEERGESSGDVGALVNYVSALNQGLELLKTLPISTRLLSQVHRTLMADVRGGKSAKTPGELRRTQNWIGGTSPATARYVPPPPGEMQKAMGALEKFLNSKNAMPLLFEIAVAHAQFETIHPFLDGNGRVGRQLITFLLSARGALSRPLLYVSHYLKQNRDEYYERLQAIRTEGDWEGWVRFFLGAVASVAAEATNRATKIVRLIEADKTRIRNQVGRKAGLGLDVLDFLIKRPIVSTRLLTETLSKTQPTIDHIIRDLEKIGIVEETTGQTRRRRYAYRAYLSLFEGGR